MKIVFATGNAHKLQEINEIVLMSLRGVSSANDMAISSNNEITTQSQIARNDKINNIEFILPPEGFDPVENGETFEENSLIKAREASRLSGMMSLADDSGLCVEALGGAPGIHSARYAETAQARIDKLLKELNEQECHCEEGVNPTWQSHYNEITTQSQIARNDNTFNRRAKFVCAMTLVDAEGKVLFQTRGECHGEIAREQSGVNGFGYDPIFLVEGTGLTMAEMSEDEKNEISHRSRALRKVLEFLAK